MIATAKNNPWKEWNRINRLLFSIATPMMENINPMQQGA
jgi:hypothetical protein